MGNTKSLSYKDLVENKPKCSKISRNSFDFENIIGRGGFGKVWKVSSKLTKKVYALKEMSKARIIDKKMEKNVMMERELLSILHNDFIVNMNYAFQDYENLYLVLDYVKGGDLRYHLKRLRRLNESQTKFLAANIITILKYIHSKNVIHRDLKPENLIFDEKGYLILTDFGIGILKDHINNSSETSGTPGYMAPEVISKMNHSFEVDYFALGVICFELMLGKRPYCSSYNRRQLRDEILSKEVFIDENSKCPEWSNEIVDFINGLLIRKPNKRLGFYGIHELIEHPWFNGFDWQKMERKQFLSPFLCIIDTDENFDRRYVCGNEDIGIETVERYQRYMEREGFVSSFLGYTYSKEDFLKLKATSLKKRNSINFGMTKKKFRLSSHTASNEQLRKSNDPSTSGESTLTSSIKLPNINESLSSVHVGLNSQNSMSFPIKSTVKSESEELNVEFPLLRIKKSSSTTSILAANKRDNSKGLIKRIEAKKIRKVIFHRIPNKRYSQSNNIFQL